MITKTAYDFCKEAGIFSGITNRFGNMLMGHGAIAGNLVQNAINRAISSGKLSKMKTMPLAKASPEVRRAAMKARYMREHPIISRLPKPVQQMMAKGILGATRFGIRRFSPENKKILWDSIVQKGTSRGLTQQQMDLAHDLFFTSKPLNEIQAAAKGLMQ